MTVMRRSSAVLIYSAIALLVGTVPAHASRLDTGPNANGGGIVWDGDSEVRTMNIFAHVLDTYNLEDVGGFQVDMTLQNDFDGLIGTPTVRLILTLDLATAATFSGSLVTLDSVSLNPWNSDLSSTGAVFNTTDPIVAFYADLVGGPSHYALSATDQARFDLLRQTSPTLPVTAGLAVRYNSQNLNSCDPDSADECTFNAARASFNLTATPAPPVPTPEPATLLLIGTGFVGSRFLRKRDPRA